MTVSWVVSPNHILPLSTVAMNSHIYLGMESSTRMEVAFVPSNQEFKVHLILATSMEFASAWDRKLILHIPFIFRIFRTPRWYNGTPKLKFNLVQTGKTSVLLGLISFLNNMVNSLVYHGVSKHKTFMASRWWPMLPTQNIILRRVHSISILRILELTRIKSEKYRIKIIDLF